MELINIFGLLFRGLTLKGVMTPEEKCKLIVTVNADFIVRANEGDSRLRGIINANTSTLDGSWPFFMASKKFPSAQIEKISGSDLIYNLADACVLKNRSLLIIGGSTQSARDAQNNINEKYNRQFCTAWSPPFEGYPFSEGTISSIKQLIEMHSPLVVAFCLGSPTQEYLAQDLLNFMSEHNVSYCIGAGGTVDFLSGRIRRAPLVIQRVGLEGVWRLLTEPTFFRLLRLWRSARIFLYAKRKWHAELPD